MAELDARKRARLRNSAFAYIDSKGRRRLPINDESHVRNALARFSRVAFEDEAARERARKKLLTAARKYGIVPIGFFTGQLKTQRRAAEAGRFVIDLERTGEPAELERRLRVVLHDPSLVVLQWSESVEGYLDGAGQPANLPGDGEGRAATLLERHGRPMTALVHDPAVLKEPDLIDTVTAAVRLVVENALLHGEAEVRATDVRSLPSGTVTFLMTDIEDSTGLLHRLGDRYTAVLADTRGVLRSCTVSCGGREVDARADEFFAAFADAGAALRAALSISRELAERAWPEGERVSVRIGIHTGRATLTDTGYVGLAVNTAARVCSAGHGGQILLSAAARSAANAGTKKTTGAGRPADKPDSLAAAGPDFLELGPVRLHGLPDPVVLFQVVGPDLPARFPPLRIDTVVAASSP